MGDKEAVSDFVTEGDWLMDGVTELLAVRLGDCERDADGLGDTVADGVSVCDPEMLWELDCDKLLDCVCDGVLEFDGEHTAFLPLTSNAA